MNGSRMKEQKEQSHLAETAEAVLSSEPAESLTTSTTEDTSMNIPTPNPQNISSPTSQNISNPNPQNSPAVDWIPAPLNLEPPPQISPSQPSLTLSPPTATRTEQEQESQRTIQNLNANNLIMNQALELFELLQFRRAAEVAKPPTIEAQHIEVAPGRAEPLSFMTLQTVEGIVSSTDFDAAQGQTSWESKMEKFVNFGHAYSSVNTVTGKVCYMVDAKLYRNILLAVAARKQNERSLATAAEKLEQHIEQIRSSNGRIMKGESDMLVHVVMHGLMLRTCSRRPTRERHVLGDCLEEAMGMLQVHD
jgi:hypothetical protein